MSWLDSYYTNKPVPITSVDDSWWNHAPKPDPAAVIGPHAGQGPFGLVPGPIGDVSDIAYNDMLKRLPTLPAMNASAASGVTARLMGQLSPETQAALQDIGARFGVASGMPGSGIARFRTARDLGRTTEDIQRAGLQDYGALLADNQRLNVSPETQIAAKERDLELAAAPDPAQQAAYQQQLFQQQLAALSRGGGGRAPSGGTGSYGDRFQELLNALKPAPSGGTGKYSTPTPAPTRGGGTGSFSNEYGDTWSTGPNGMNFTGGSYWDDPNAFITENGIEYGNGVPTMNDFTQEELDRYFGDTFEPYFPTRYDAPLVPGQSYGPWDEDWWNT